MESLGLHEGDIALSLASMLTGKQIRMARAALGWSAKVLAEKSGVSYPVIQRAESSNEIPNMLARNLLKIKGAFESEGIAFTDPSADHVGVVAPKQ